MAMRFQRRLRSITCAVGLFVFIVGPWNSPASAETTTFTGYPTYWLGRAGEYHLARAGAISGADSESPRTVEAASAELTFDPINGGEVTGKLRLTVSGLFTTCGLKVRGPVTWEYVREFTGTYDPNTKSMSGSAVWKPTLVSNEDPEEPNCPEPGPKPEITDYIWQVRFTYPSGLSDDMNLDAHEHELFDSPVNPESGGIIAIWGVPNRAEGKAGVLAVVWNPEVTGCEVSHIEGAFEPTQGVFQNDYTFADKLIPTSPNRYRAELDMVKGRPTQIVGTKGPTPKVERGVFIKDSVRDRFVIKGKANGTKEVDAHIRFIVKQGSSQSEIYRSEEVYKVPLGRPCGEMQAFEVALDVNEGVPAPFFAFRRTGDYQIIGELVRVDGIPTGVGVTVEGKVVETQPMEIHFVPVVISADTAAKKAELKTFTDALADFAEKRIPDYFPLEPGGIEAVKYQKVEDATAYVDGWTTWTRESDLRAGLTDLMRTGSLLSGADRVVAVLYPEDIGRIRHFGPAAFALTKKIIYLRSTSPDALDEATFTLAHELVHTLPFHWSDSQIESECRINFHNYEGAPEKTKPEHRIAHGHGVTFKGSGIGARGRGMRKMLPIMAGEYSNKWITQCTYLHLLKELSKPVIDPEVILMRGLIDRSDVPIHGQLFPAYQLDGVLDLEAGMEGDWAIRLRDAGGSELSRFPFTPDFDMAYPEEERAVTTFGYRIPTLPETAQIDLVGPEDTLLDSAYYSAHVPTVAIIDPVEGHEAILEFGGTVHVEWTGKDDDGDNLLYSVLYAPTSPWSWSGNTWQTLSFERADTAFDVPVDQTHYRGYPHTVRVIATDGTQSAVGEIEFLLLRCLDHTMAKGIYEDIRWPISRTDEFLATDERAVSWVEVGPMSTTHKIEWNWLSPQGDLYLYEGPLIIGEVGQPSDDWTAWSQIDIAGAAASSLPGLWTVEVLVDGRPLVKEQFTLRTN